PSFAWKYKPVGRSFRRLRGLPIGGILVSLRQFRDNRLYSLHSLISTLQHLIGCPTMPAAVALTTPVHRAVCMRSAVDNSAASGAERAVHKVAQEGAIAFVNRPGLPCRGGLDCRCCDHCDLRDLFLGNCLV